MVRGCMVRGACCVEEGRNGGRDGEREGGRKGGREEEKAAVMNRTEQNSS